MLFFFTRTLLGYTPREKFPLERWLDGDDADGDGDQREAAVELDRDIPIIDAHHHLWDLRTQDKGWPIPTSVIQFLYKIVHPDLLTKLIATISDPRVIRFFTANKFPAVIPYMENEMIRDMENLEQSELPVPTPLSTRDTKPSHNIVGTVYIECGWSDPSTDQPAMKTVPEVTVMAQGVANQTNNRLCTGIIGHIDLSLGGDAVRPALVAMKEGSRNFRGIRDPLARRTGLYPMEANDPRKAYDANFRTGLTVVTEMDLIYETWLFQDNLASLRDLAIAFPRTRIVCDHVGTPVCLGGDEEEEEGSQQRDLATAYEEWKVSIQQLAQSCPNVMMKLSGLGMPCVGFDFHQRPRPPTSVELAEAWGPYILWCLEQFGVDRCFFASNAPVDKVSCSYTSLWNAYKIIVRDFSREDKNKLFHDNAVRIYRL